MEVQFGPNSVDEPNLLYKLQRKIKVFNSTNALPNRGYNLVASSSKYGIVFVAAPNGILSAYSLKELINNECEPKHHRVQLEVQPTHISVNCDQEWLAVIGGQKLYIYKVLDFQSQNVLPSGMLNCDVNPGTYVSVLQWNPCIPEAIAIVFFDGTLLICQIHTMLMKKMVTTARCLCWSPKGKQLVTGNNDGTLCQYKPDLSPTKTVPAPKLFEGAPVEALAIHWISTYQFAVVFKNSSDNSRPAVTIINTPKGGQPICYNYEDICYSLGSNRPWYYYLQGITQWNIILSSSSNSMEIATLGSADGANWLQWCQTDEARPELPLTDKKQENYPVGITIDTCAIHQLPWGENEVLPTMPLLHVVSQTGLLSIFNVIYLNKAAPQICMPPQQLSLPAAVVTSEIPDDTPSQPEQPPPAYPAMAESQAQNEKQEQPSQPPAVPILQVPQISAASFFSPATVQAKSFETPQQQIKFGNVQPPPPPEEKYDLKPVATSEHQSEPRLPDTSPPIQQQPTQSEVDAALKSEQQRDEMNKAKMHKELTEMLVKEVNEFQMELYRFTLKTRETEVRLQRDIQNINTNHSLLSLDTDKLVKECMLDGLRTSINQLKLELVRACAVVAEARSHSETKDLPQWAQADPLTAKRVDCVRKLAYYVQNQLDQARKALDLKWNEIKSNDPDNKQVHMIRPILDDVYQPLVKQQEILMRQQAVLKTMKNTLKDCDVGPVFRSTSILRNTPFKRDLSKLTKNIINMKIESSERSKETMLSSQKLDALRDMLSNHKPTKVKPVNVELRHQLAAMYKSYKKSLSEKTEPTRDFTVKSEPYQKADQLRAPPPTPVTKTEAKPDIVKESPKTYAPAFDMKPVKSGLAGVSRNLFSAEPKVEQQRPVVSSEPSATSAPTTITPNTKSLLIDLLQNKSQAAANAEPKSDSNTFMGQNICSPTAFNFSKPPAAAAPSAIFASKQGSFPNVFSKFQQPNSQAESLSQGDTSSSKSSETGEPEGSADSAQYPDNKAKEEKPMTNLFAMKPSATQNVPDVLKSNTKSFSFGKVDSTKFTITPITSEADSKENLQVECSQKQEAAGDDNKISTKTFYVQFSNKTTGNAPSPQPVIIVDFHKDKNGVKNEISKSGESSVFGAPNTIGSKTPAVAQPSILFGSEGNVSKSTIITPLPSTISVFGSSTGNSKPGNELKTTAASGSIFSPTAPTTGTIGLTSSQASVFVSSTTTKSSVFNTSTAPTIFSSPTVKAATPTSSTTDSTLSETTTTQSPEKSQSSAFSSTNTASSVFASANASAFGTKNTTQTSILATSTESTTITTTAATESAASSTKTASSIFGNAPNSAQGIFSAAVSKASFGPDASTKSIFGAATTTSQSSVFGTTTDQKSVFGGTQTSATVFGASTTSTPQTPVFGTATQAPASVFGTTTTQSSVFGGTLSAQSSVFGTSSATTQASVFGTSSSSTQPSVFGTPTPSTKAPVFGTPTPTTPASVFGATSTQSSVFGTTGATTQATVFGTPTPATQASVFGTPSSTQASVFGATTPTTQASVFGTPPQTTQTSVFGTPATTTQSATPFGGAESNLFAAATISPSNAANQGGGSSLFGGSPSGSVFGSSTTNVFGGKSTFGQPNPTAASIFGGGASFGQKPATDFWSGASNTTTSGFGSSGFGQTATTQASSIFGSSTGGSFSTPTAAPAFGSPQPTTFSGGEGQTSVFGTPQQTAAPAFGGSPVFGSKPVFGQSSGFGSPTASAGFGAFGGFNKSPGGGFGASASFGSGATFGGSAFGNTSPGKVFGGSSPSFANPTQSNATFESLATQNTLTFGNLAQQSGQPQAAAPPSFNASPSFTGWRG